MGYVMVLNNAVVNWYSKMQGSIKGATFRLEFMAMKTAVKPNQGFHYKLQMMGVPLDGLTYMYGDNMSILHNVGNLESALKKKSNSIAYDMVQEAMALDEV